MMARGLRQIFPKLYRSSGRARAATACVGQWAPVTALTARRTFRFTQLRCSVLGTAWRPRLRHNMEHSFWTALIIVAANVVRPVHCGLPDGLVSFTNTSSSLPDAIWLDLQRRAGSAALGQIVRCMLIQVKPRIRLSRPPIPKNIPPIMHGVWESGFPPDVIHTNATRLGRLGFTPVLLCSNTPLQSESRKEPFCNPS